MAFQAGLKGLRGSLEVSLESDDLTPVILLTCQGAARQSTEAEAIDSPATGRHEAQPIWISEGTLQAVVQALRGIAERRDAEVERAFQANSSQITKSLRELSAIQDITSEVRRRLQEIGSSLQRLGGDFSAAVGSLEESLLVRDRVQEAKTAVATAIDILERCQAARSSLEAGELHQARSILAGLAAQYASDLQGAARGHASSGHDEFEGGTAVAPTSPAHFLGSLAPLLSAHIISLEEALEQKLTAALHLWLTDARGQAAVVGQRAMRRAQAQRQRQERKAAERAAVVSKLLHRNPKNGSYLSARAAAALFEQEGVASRVAVGETVEGDDPAAVLNMTPLLRCIHNSAGDGSITRLLAAYTEARQAQLGADLAPSADLLSCHVVFLPQVVGYFVVEARVAALAPQLGSKAHMEIAWEGAAAAIAAELGAALDEAGSAEDALVLKDAALLACDGIDLCCGGALSTHSIRSMLQGRVQRHRALLSSDAAAQLECIGSDATAVDGWVRGLATACTAYLQGLVPAHEMPAAVASECQLAVANALSISASSALLEVQEEPFDASAAADANAALQRCFFLLAAGERAKQTLASLTPREAVVNSPGQDGASAGQLDGALAHVQKALGRHLGLHAGPAVMRCAELDWAPDAMPRTGGAMGSQFGEILEAMRAVRAAVTTSCLPEGQRCAVLAAAVHWTGQLLLRLMESDAVPTWNVYGAQRLLSDISALGRFADETAGGRHPCLSEPLALFEAVAFNSAEGLLDPDARAKKFAAMDCERAAALLEKLRDVEEVGPWGKVLTRQRAAEIAAQLREGALEATAQGQSI